VVQSVRIPRIDARPVANDGSCGCDAEGAREDPRSPSQHALAIAGHAAAVSACTTAGSSARTGVPPAVCRQGQRRDALEAPRRELLRRIPPSKAEHVCALDPQRVEQRERVDASDRS